MMFLVDLLVQLAKCHLEKLGFPHFTQDAAGVQNGLILHLKDQVIPTHDYLYS